MTFSRIQTTTGTGAPAPLRDGRLAWVARCCASIVAREPWRDVDDVLDLASTLWDLPRCCGLLPEFAAGLLLDEQLGRLG